MHNKQFMYQDKKISLIIPCLNEEEGIKEILLNKPAFIDEVVVVDNGSEDNTAEVARSFGAKVILENKKGYGFAYLTGFKLASGDVFITMDGDNSYSISETSYLLEYLFEKGCDFISGCRFPLKERRTMNFINRIGNYILTAAFIVVTFRLIKDSQSGMWVFKHEVLNKMELKSGGMSLSEEIKMEATLNKTINFKEALINYSARAGNTKLNKWKDGVLNLMYLFKKRIELLLR